MRYFVTVGGVERVVDVNRDSRGGVQVSVDGTAHHVQWSPVPGTPLINLLLDGESWTVAVQRQEPGKWMLGLVGERSEVETVDETARRIRALGTRRAARTGPQAIHAPMPGLVVRILVRDGQEVAAGAPLVVVEAMKMENELRAARPGVVSALNVRVGDAVEKGTLLVTLTDATA